jgi:FkbM family methyltransferase
MEPLAARYKPSLLNFSKYLTYADYFKEYIACGDFKSLGASLRYMFTHKLPGHDFRASSRMGSFHIRKGTTDFQFINSAYERKVKNFIKAHLADFDVFIDAGACIGEYSVWLAKLGKRCIAIEPVNFEAVRRNVALNGLEDRVQVLACGLGNKKGRVYFNIPSGLPSSSYMDKDSDKEPNVDIETLDGLMPRLNIGPNDRVLMKMDVEGMEPELIEGARQFISSQPSLILVLYEHFDADDFRNDKALSAHGRFEFSDIDGVNRAAVKKPA